MSGRRAVGSILLILVLGALFLYRAGVHEAERRALPQRDGLLRVAGLKGSVTVRRGADGVPHIRSEDQLDAFFALGFVHAQDRLVQMEWSRRRAQGRLAEWLGAEALPVDRESRTLGIARSAAAQVERLDGDVAAALIAYSAGVNARLERIRSGEAARPEPLVDLEIEDWRPEDSIALVKTWAWELNGTLKESLVLWDLIEHLGGRSARPFVPPDAAGPLDPLTQEIATHPMSPPKPLLARPGALVSSPRSSPLDNPFRARGLRGRSVGSSAWLVAPDVADGRGALLVGDFHLEATAPGLFYLAHWRGADFELAGATIPGIPVVWSGHNGHVAWVVTEPRASVVDLFKETLDPGRPDSYRVGTELHRLEQRDETIRVRGGTEEVLKVRETTHGPLVHALDGQGRQPLAVSWPSLWPGDGITALLRAGRAKDRDSFRESLRQHHEPALVFLFSDRHGEGGRQLAGFYPERNPRFPTALVPVEGRARSRYWDWSGPIPFDELPWTPLEPETRWLIAADNPLGNAQGEGLIEWWWRDGARAERIDRLMRATAKRGPVELRDLVAIQGDQGIDQAAARARQVLDLVGNPASLPAESRRLYEVLSGWSGDMAANEVGAAAWHSVQNQILRSLEPVFGEELFRRYLSLRGFRPGRLIDPLLREATKGRERLLGLVDRDDFLEALRGGFRRAGLELRVRLGPDPTRWRWGRLHSLRFEPLAPVWGGRGGLGPFEYGGSGLTVSVGEYDLVAPFETRVISGFRIAMDASNPSLALCSFAPGVAEAPSDPLRDSGMSAWLRNEASILTTDSALIQERTERELVLEPSQ